MISMFLKNGMYLSFCFFYILPRAIYGYIQCGFIPSAAWRFSNIFSSSFRCEKLALTRETSYIHIWITFRCSWQACWVLSGIWVCLAICALGASVCPHTFPLCPFVNPHTYVHSPACLYIPHTSRGHLGGIYHSVRHFCTCHCPYVQPLLISSCITGGLSYQLINIIVGHLQSHVWLAVVPMYSGYFFLCFLL